MILNPTSRILWIVGAAAFIVIGCGKDETIKLNATGADAGDGNSQNGGQGPNGDDVPITPPGPPVVPPGPSVIGAACEKDADCGVDGVICLTADGDGWRGGGPANGYCTADCSASTADTDICTTFDGNSACLTSGDSAFCVALCAPGNPPAGSAKCQNRPDLACDSVSVMGGSYCRPICRNNADCGDRFCDLGLGVCVDKLPAGDPLGAECDPNSAEPSTCASGICSPLSDNYGFCSGLCARGNVGCGSETEALVPENPGDSICLIPTVMGSGLSDLSQCIQRCNCDGDCGHPEALCWQFASTEAESIAAIGTVGVCVSPDFQDDIPEPDRTPLGIACVAKPDSGMMTPDSGAAPKADAGKDGG